MKLSISTLVLVLFVLASRAGAEETFVRGSLGGAPVGLSTAVAMLNVLTGQVPPTAFLDCQGAFLFEAADVNDNEHFTVADVLYLTGNMFEGGPTIPAPFPECGPDPTEDQHGFDAVDPAYALRAARIRVTGAAAEIDVEISSPQAVKGVQFAIEHAPGMSLQGFIGAYPGPAPGPLVRSLFDTRATVTLMPARAATILPAGTGGAFVPLGTLSFSLADEGAHAGMTWVPELLAELTCRASVVTEDFADHHPALLSEVPGLTPSGSDGFRRGDLDRSGAVNLADGAALLDFLWQGGAAPVSCDGSDNLDAADVNDNEYVTVADYLGLAAALGSGAAIPAPSSDCGFDSGNSTAGFTAVDPEYLVSAGQITVTPPTGPLNRKVWIPILVRAPGPVTGVQLVLSYDASALTPVEDEAAFQGVGAAFQRVVAPGTLEIGMLPRSGEVFLVEGGALLNIGTVSFRLADHAVFSPLSWAAEVEQGSLIFRASVVDADFADHHPRLVSGEYEFARGNANADRSVDISDAMFTLNYLFLRDGERPVCADAADANNDESVDISDPIYTLNYLFLGGRRIPEPFPQCGFDSGIGLLGCQALPETDACHR